MKIKAIQTVSNVQSFEDLRRFTDQMFNQIVAAINGNLSFADNIEGSLITYTFTLANTTYQIPHTLEYTPCGYIVISKSVSTDIYDGMGTFNEKFIFLKSTVAGATVKLMVI